MLRKILLSAFTLFIFSQSATAETLLFVGEGCPFCTELRTTLSQKDFYNKFKIAEYEIYYNLENKDLYLEKSKEVGYTAGSVPLLIDNKEYREGTAQIIAYLEDKEKKNFPTTKLDEASIDELDTIIADFDQPETAASFEEQSENKIWKIILIVAVGLSMALSPFFWRKYRRKNNRL